MTRLALHLTAGDFFHTVNPRSFDEAEHIARQAPCDIAVLVDGNHDEFLLKNVTTDDPKPYALPNNTLFYARNPAHADRIRATCT